MTIMRLTHDGKTMTVAEWAAETGMSVARIHQRMRKGFTDSEVLHPTRLQGADMDTFEDDDFTWYVTHVHPNGITLEECGSLFGVTRERIRQIELVALKKFKLITWLLEDLPKRKTGAERKADEDRLLARYAGRSLRELAIAKNLRIQGKVRAA